MAYDLEKAIKMVKWFTPKYAVIGVKHDGYRKLPATFEVINCVVCSDAELYKTVSELEWFQVYEIGKSAGEEAEIRKAAENHFGLLKDEKQRKKYLKLKKKFES